MSCSAGTIIAWQERDRMRKEEETRNGGWCAVWDWRLANLGTWGDWKLARLGAGKGEVPR